MRFVRGAEPVLCSTVLRCTAVRPLRRYRTYGAARCAVFGEYYSFFYAKRAPDWMEPPGVSALHYRTYAMRELVRAHHLRNQ